MARWNEDQERWQGYGDRHVDDDRRLRAERGEGGVWRWRERRGDEPDREWPGTGFEDRSAREWVHADARRA